MSQIFQGGGGDTNDWWINISRRHVRMGTARLKCICNHLDRFYMGLQGYGELSRISPTARAGKNARGQLFKV